MFMQLEEDYATGQYTWHSKCVMCKQEQTFKVEGPEVFAYSQGAFVQVAFPNLSADNRELMISGVCSNCWDKMYGDDEE